MHTLLGAVMFRAIPPSLIPMFQSEKGGSNSSFRCLGSERNSSWMAFISERKGIMARWALTPLPVLLWAARPFVSARMKTAPLWARTTSMRVGSQMMPYRRPLSASSSDRSLTSAAPQHPTSSSAVNTT